VRTKTPQQADKMLDAAGKLFGSSRFHEVRMEDIAAEAEVGKGTIYRYFSDKEELYLALLERSAQQLVDRLRKERASIGCPQRQLERIVAGIIDFFDVQPHLLDLIQRAEVLHDPNRTSPWHKAREELTELMLALFQAGQKAGNYDIRDPEISAMFILGGLRSIVRFGRKPRPANLSRCLVEIFLRGADISGNKCSNGAMQETRPNKNHLGGRNS
jgi:AcrR family transcriptional regulator